MIYQSIATASTPSTIRRYATLRSQSGSKQFLVLNEYMYEFLEWVDRPTTFFPFLPIATVFPCFSIFQNCYVTASQPSRKQRETAYKLLLPLLCNPTTGEILSSAMTDLPSTNTGGGSCQERFHRHSPIQPLVEDNKHTLV